MRGPPRPGTRMHVPVGDVATLIEMSEKLVEKAEAALDGSKGSLQALHKAEQVQLLVRLAADSGARRGELAALRFGDLDGRVLTIERGVSGEEVGPTKTRQVRRLTLGRTAVELWRVSEAETLISAQMTFSAQEGRRHRQRQPPDQYQVVVSRRPRKSITSVSSCPPASLAMAREVGTSRSSSRAATTSRRAPSLSTGVVALLHMSSRCAVASSRALSSNSQAARQGLERMRYRMAAAGQRWSRSWTRTRLPVDLAIFCPLIITVPTCIQERAKGATPVKASAIAAS